MTSSLNKGTNLIGAASPNTLASLPSIINNVGSGASSADSDLAKALIGAQKLDDFSSSLTGGDKLAELMGKTLDAAESARKDALSNAQSMASKALDKLPDVLKANAAAKDDAQKEADASAAKADANATKRNDRLKAAVDSLKSNAESNQNVADAKADQGSADKFAAAVVKSAMGGVDLPADWAAQLFDAYKDSTTHPKGSPAFLKALGLSD